MQKFSKRCDFSLVELEDVIREVLESGGEFEICPSGKSMLPLIKEGRDLVTLVKAQAFLSEGDIALYKRECGQFVLHRVMRSENGVYAMCGDNQTVLEKGIKHSQILGKVCRMTINGKTLDVNDKKHLRYVKRRRNLFLRRISLFLCRRNPFIKK